MPSIYEIFQWLVKQFRQGEVSEAAAYIAFAVIVVTAYVGWRNRRTIRTLWKMGTGLSRIKIAVFSKPENMRSVVNALKKSGPFRDSVVTEIDSDADIEYARKASLFLVYWDDEGARLEKVLNLKKSADEKALIVYAPPEFRKIDDGDMKKLNETPNTTVTRFRGRLLNDIVTGMIAASYK